MRVKVDWRSASIENYKNFCKKHPSIKLTYDEWRNIIYTYNESFKEYILETGEKAKLPYGDNLWPAFWMWSWDSWPPEIDIFEGYTNNKTTER